MITSDQMRQIMIDLSLRVVPVKVNGSVIGWLAQTIDGHRAGPKHPPYSTPEEAVEAAKLRFDQASIRDAESKSSLIISALERGRYFIRVRNQASTGPEGEPTIAKLFSAILPNGNPTPVVDRITFIQAVIDMEKLLP